MLRNLLTHHVLVNMTFVLVLAMGIASFTMMPREQDPTVNFNWINITTVLPGASAEDVERRVTDPIERNLRRISDVRFVTSTSREGVSTILVRFEDIDDATFNERVADLRREVQRAEDELPDHAEDPEIIEITTANAFPTATVVVTSPGGGEQLRVQAENVRRDIERMRGVDDIHTAGLHKPELQVAFDPVAVERHGLAPDELADTVRGYLRDISAGSVDIGEQNWLVRILATSPDPALLGAVPVTTADGEVRLDALAHVQRGRGKPESMVSFDGRPAVTLGVTKDAGTNTLELVERINRYIEERNAVAGRTGVTLVLADDQTQATRDALGVMQRNMLIGLVLVLAVAWLFLGSRIALLASIGIPFILAGTFWLLFTLDQTLNVMVLLGVVIALGMLVDAMVVVIESIYYRLVRGLPAADAVIEGLREVWKPVLTSVLTTLAAFMPLLLLPGILGQFMSVVPMVVSTALLLSLVQAFWILPTHVTAAKIDLRSRPSAMQRRRTVWMRHIRSRYTRWLARVMRRPGMMLVSALLLFVLALTAVLTETGVRRDFFAFDPVRLFYVNVEMPIGTPLERTLEKTEQVEGLIREGLREEEVRAVVSYSGQMFTDAEPLFGNHYGQILVAMKSHRPGMRTVSDIVDAMRPRVTDVTGAGNVSFLQLSGGPPATRPISVKVRGDDFDDIRAAVDDLTTLMRDNPHITDIVDDDATGQMSLTLRVDAAAAHRAGIPPERVARTVRLMVDGEIVTAFQDAGEEREVRVLARHGALPGVEDALAITLPSPHGGRVPLTTLLDVERGPGLAAIRHFDFRRAITIEADIDRRHLDTVSANDWIRGQWEEIRERHPDVSLDFTGLLDDIIESLDAMAVLFLLGVGLIYLILGTQFRSYFQPLLILATVPMAFTGVVAGLAVTGNPLSLYTLYGIIALGGIAVNASIVLVSAANERLAAGMTPTHATLLAARRRVIPILITSTTTVAGLFSLATGLGGRSLLWGPVATAIVWGLIVSTVLTLFVIPTLYWWFMRWRYR